MKRLLIKLMLSAAVFFGVNACFCGYAAACGAPSVVPYQIGMPLLFLLMWAVMHVSARCFPQKTLRQTQIFRVVSGAMFWSTAAVWGTILLGAVDGLSILLKERNIYGLVLSADKIIFLLAAAACICIVWKRKQVKAKFLAYLQTQGISAGDVRTVSVQYRHLHRLRRCTCWQITAEFCRAPEMIRVYEYAAGQFAEQSAGK